MGKGGTKAQELLNDMTDVEKKALPYVSNLPQKKVIFFSQLYGKEVIFVLFDGDVVDGIISAVNGAYVTLRQELDDTICEETIMLEDIRRVQHSYPKPEPPKEETLEEAVEGEDEVDGEN